MMPVDGLITMQSSYGPEETALKFTGLGDIRFGAAPLIHAVLSARQLDADRFVSKDNSAEPVRAWPALRALISAIPPAPIPAQVELSTEQVMLGGRPLQDIAAALIAGLRADENPALVKGVASIYNFIYRALVQA